MDRVHIIFFFFLLESPVWVVGYKKNVRKFCGSCSYHFFSVSIGITYRRGQNDKSAAAAVAVPVKYWRARTISSDAAY